MPKLTMLENYGRNAEEYPEHLFQGWKDDGDTRDNSIKKESETQPKKARHIGAIIGAICGLAFILYTLGAPYTPDFVSQMLPESAAPTKKYETATLTPKKAYAELRVSNLDNNRQEDIEVITEDVRLTFLGFGELYKLVQEKELPDYALTKSHAGVTFGFADGDHTLDILVKTQRRTYIFLGTGMGWYRLLEDERFQLADSIDTPLEQKLWNA